MSAPTAASLDLRPGSRPYIENAYSEAAERERVRKVVPLDTIEIKQDQQSVVIKHLAHGLSSVESESLGYYHDQGEVSPNNIAKQYGRYPDGVPRALKRLDDIMLIILVWQCLQATLEN